MLEVHALLYICETLLRKCKLGGVVVCVTVCHWCIYPDIVCDSVQGWSGSGFCCVSPSQHMAAACIFTAAKVEEAPRRLRDVINVFHHLKQKRMAR